MNLLKTLNDNLENDGISQKRMKYYYDLKTVTDRLQKYPEMQHITSMDVTDLEQHSVKKLRILAQCLGITKPNIITSKEELIHSIDTIYRSIERFEEETDDKENKQTGHHTVTVTSRTKGATFSQYRCTVVLWQCGILRFVFFTTNVC